MKTESGWRKTLAVSNLRRVCVPRPVLHVRAVADSGVRPMCVAGSEGAKSERIKSTTNAVFYTGISCFRYWPEGLQSWD